MKELKVKFLDVGRSAYLWFALKVEQPILCRFGTVCDCGCIYFRDKQRFVCFDHFVKRLREEISVKEKREEQQQA